MAIRWKFVGSSCWKCDGRGWTDEWFLTIMGTESHREPCKECAGLGNTAWAIIGNDRQIYGSIYLVVDETGNPVAFQVRGPDEWLTEANSFEDALRELEKATSLRSGVLDDVSSWGLEDDVWVHGIDAVPEPIPEDHLEW